ncbi:hypothetical protein VF05_20175 [Nostoc linckia z3]|nr:hypothetical protein VF05_20175 [Nostoc linckia z3]
MLVAGWGDGEMGRWGDGEMVGRWGDGRDKEEKLLPCPPCPSCLPCLPSHAPCPMPHAPCPMPHALSARMTINVPIALALSILYSLIN